jgi:hypothetical protein
VNDQQQQKINMSPMSDLELNYMVTEPVWGNEVSEEFKDALKEVYLIKNQQDEIEEIKESLWGILALYTRDIRLSNLAHNIVFDELTYVRYYLDLSADLLASGYKKASLVALKNAITIIETSQGKGGFLRRQMQTFRTEQKQEILEPKRKTLFGGNKRD